MGKVVLGLCGSGGFDGFSSRHRSARSAPSALSEDRLYFLGRELNDHDRRFPQASNGCLLLAYVNSSAYHGTRHQTKGPGRLWVTCPLTARRPQPFDERQHREYVAPDTYIPLRSKQSSANSLVRNRGTGTIASLPLGFISSQ